MEPFMVKSLKMIVYRELEVFYGLWSGLVLFVSVTPHIPLLVDFGLSFLWVSFCQMNIIPLPSPSLPHPLKVCPLSFYSILFFFLFLPIHLFCSNGLAMESIFLDLSLSLSQSSPDFCISFFTFFYFLSHNDRKSTSQFNNALKSYLYCSEPTFCGLFNPA